MLGDSLKGTVTFGVMLYQSVAYFKKTGEDPILAVNQYFESDEYFGSSFVTITNFTDGPDVFMFAPDVLVQSEIETSNSLPAFQATMDGYAGASIQGSPYFYVDFT